MQKPPTSDELTAETELLDFLYSLIQLVKPQRAIETGSWQGRSAVAIGRAMRNNGFGKVVSLELDSEAAGRAHNEIETAGLCDWIEIVVGQSLVFQSSNEVEFVLVDSDAGIRADEFSRFYDNLPPGAVIVFRDTGAQRSAEAMKELISQERLAGSFFPILRGIFVGTVQKALDLPGLGPVRGGRNFGETVTRRTPVERTAIFIGNAPQRHLGNCACRQPARRRVAGALVTSRIWKSAGALGAGATYAD